jgi:hypothetical protein
LLFYWRVSECLKHGNAFTLLCFVGITGQAAYPG